MGVVSSEKNGFATVTTHVWNLMTFKNESTGTEKHWTYWRKIEFYNFLCYISLFECIRTGHRNTFKRKILHVIREDASLLGYMYMPLAVPIAWFHLV
jgi:hypothetical protein